MSGGEITDVGTVTSPIRRGAINILAEAVSALEPYLKAIYRCSPSNL